MARTYYLKPGESSLKGATDVITIPYAELIKAEAEEARRLRDQIYGPTTERNWLECRAKWIADLPWLRANAS